MPGKTINGYALDTLPVPQENPYGAWLRTSALAFFDDGRCAVATYTGDIWIVSGIDAELRHVTWRRFATGLYEPFGVLVIDGMIYVTCRDGIKRLHDLNHDGRPIQQWLDDPRFGPLAGKDGSLFHSSFGKGWVYYLMLEQIDGVTQSACVTLPHQWDAGVQRMRVNPADGQLYGVGLSRWQGPRGGKNGCLQRLRWTGQPARLLDDVRMTPDGLELSFNFELDPAAAANPANYQIEIWNYQWAPRYGSKFHSVKTGGKEGIDRLEVAAAVPGADRRNVRLSIPGLVPCDQLKAVLDLRDHTGVPFRQEFLQTIHRSPEK